MPFNDLGISRTEFFEQYYSRAPYLKRNAFERSNFSWKHLDEALYGWEPRSREIRLFKNGPLDEASYIETYEEVGEKRRRVIKDALYKNLEDGATLILNKLQHRSAIINDYCMAVSQFLGEKTNVNAYIAFGGEGSFGKHWDTHDVFAVQLIGRKHWRVYEPTFDLPLSGQHSVGKSAECPETPLLDIVLEAGDILYVPRGYWHEVLPIEGVPTLHLAIGAFPPRMTDYLMWIAATVLPSYLEARQSFTPYVDSTEQIAEFSTTLERLLKNPEYQKRFYLHFAETQRVQSRFGIHKIIPGASSNLSVNAERKSVRLNSFLPSAAYGETPIVNGIKLNALDEISCNFLDRLERGNESRGDADDFFSEEQCRFINQLAKEDIVELITSESTR